MDDTDGATPDDAPGAFDDSRPCAVCGCIDNGDDDDLIVACDNPACDIYVHLTCYGAVKDFDENKQWFCDSCRSGKEPRAMSCRLCGQGGVGAYKPLVAWEGEDEQLWCHVVCYYFNTETNTVNEDTISPVYVRDRANVDSQACSVCKKQYGLVVNCRASPGMSKDNLCKRLLHPTCAVRHIHSRRESDGSTVFDFWCFCEQHKNYVPSESRARRGGSRRVAEDTAMETDSGTGLTDMPPTADAQVAVTPESVPAAPVEPAPPAVGSKRPHESAGDASVLATNGTAHLKKTFDTIMPFDQPPPAKKARVLAEAFIDLRPNGVVRSSASSAKPRPPPSTAPAPPLPPGPLSKPSPPPSIAPPPPSIKTAPSLSPSSSGKASAAAAAAPTQLPPARPAQQQQQQQQQQAVKRIPAANGDAAAGPSKPAAVLPRLTLTPSSSADERKPSATATLSLPPLPAARKSSSTLSTRKAKAEADPESTRQLTSLVEEFQRSQRSLLDGLVKDSTDQVRRLLLQAQQSAATAQAASVSTAQDAAVAAALQEKQRLEQDKAQLQKQVDLLNARVADLTREAQTVRRRDDDDKRARDDRFAVASRTLKDLRSSVREIFRLLRLPNVPEELPKVDGYVSQLRESLERIMVDTAADLVVRAAQDIVKSL